MINSGQSLTLHTISSRNDKNNKEIDKTPLEVFTLAPQFANLPQGETSKIF